MDHLIVKNAHLFGLPTGMYSFIVLTLEDATSHIITATAWFSFFIAVISFFVMVEKYTDMDVPFINVKKDDERKDTK